jgi:cell division protein FtsL
MEAARDAGEVVQMQQSTYDVGAQVADVDARIKALEASLVRLTALMDEAKDITDVITLEQAISQRQSELDALKAQQRDLANQTAMSQISLTLMSPDDAQNSVDPQPQQTWWESFLDGLSQFWSWFGSALLIISPLLIAMGIIAWVRRRRTRRAAPTTPQTPQPAPAPAGAPEAATPTDPTT